MSELPPAGSSAAEEKPIGYNSEKELLIDFQQSLRDSGSSLEAATTYLYQSLVDEAILGLAFEVHHAIRTGLAAALASEPEDTKSLGIVDEPDSDVFGVINAKIAMDCTCPKCDRAVAASRFAPHLEKCMGKRLFFFLIFPSLIVQCNHSGMGRNSSRIASRRIASSREGGSYFGTALSDDEDDTDWSVEKRKKKIQPVRTNGTKKNGKTS